MKATKPTLKVTSTPVSKEVKQAVAEYCNPRGIKLRHFGDMALMAYLERVDPERIGAGQ